MKALIRAAVSDDLEVVKGFNGSLTQKEYKDFDPTINPDFIRTESGHRYFKKSIEGDTSLVLIAEVEDMPVGYAIANIEETSDYRTVNQLCEVDNMWVEKEYRSLGIGRQFIDRIKEWSQTQGVNRMRVVASFENQAAIAFYKREGFGEHDLILEQDLK